MSEQHDNLCTINPCICAELKSIRSYEYHMNRIEEEQRKMELAKQVWKDSKK